MPTSFAAFGVPTAIVDVLTAAQIIDPTPIQAATLPDSLAGRDVLGRGRTGSGKTYAFLIPLVARLAGGPSARSGAPRALILAPTRELVGQIEASLAPLATATGLTTRTVYGGVGQNPQVAALQRGVDIVLACPGRLEDLIAQGHCRLDKVEVTVLDEADHMADLGFLPAVRRLLAKTPASGQRLFFSATLDNGINALTKQFLSDPVTHQADSAQSPVATMTHHVLQVERDLRVPVVADLASASARTVVFTRTKHGAKGLARQLNSRGVPAVELHGNLSQNARTRSLDAFHGGEARVLVATDIAARGIHVDDVALVIHADPPAEHKAYLHRSGRTARAGNEGTVVTIMTREQRGDVRALTKAAGISPTTTTVTAVSDAVLSTIAPGERDYSGAFAPKVAPAAATAKKAPQRPGGHPRAGGETAAAGTPSRSRRRRPSGAKQATSQPRGGQSRSGGAASASGQQQSGQQRSGQSQRSRQQSGQQRSGQQRSGQRAGGRSGGGSSSRTGR